MHLQRRSQALNLQALFAAWLCLAWPLAALGHGWYKNPLLATPSPSVWLSDVKAAAPDVFERLDQTDSRVLGNLRRLKRREKPPANKQAKDGGSSGGPGNAGVIEAELSRQRRALLSRKAHDCLEVLAFLAPSNVPLDEFPTFPIYQIDNFRETAAKLLVAMGPEGTAAVANELSALLMGSGRTNNAIDYQVHPGYFRQLVDLLRVGGAAGNLTAEAEDQLRQASSGAKPPRLHKLAEDVLRTLDDIDQSHANLARVAQLLASTDDLRSKHRLLTGLRRHLPKASLHEVLGLLDTDPERSLRQLTLVELRRRLGSASELELMQLESSVADPALEHSALVELAGRSPRYSEVKDDLDQLVKFAQSERAELAKAAQRQIANAYQRAPIGACLTWLGEAEEPLRALTWTQIDGRIARADRRRLTLYRDVALERLQDDQAPRSEKEASLELLGRLDAALVVGPLVELLPQLPRELWPPAGDALRRLTRQDFGPRVGDGVAEFSSELKQWQAWIKKHAPDKAR